MNKNAIAVNSNHIALTKQAALRHGKQLSANEAHNHASKIIEWMESAGEEDEYGQDFWTAAKEYFLN